MSENPVTLYLYFGDCSRLTAHAHPPRRDSETSGEPSNCLRCVEIVKISNIGIRALILFLGCTFSEVLSWAERMRIVLDVASALRYLHDEWVQCVVHRDIKASNVMIDSESRARLGDFGTARLMNHGRAQQNAITNNVAGTVGYIAPECILTGEVTKESDVYSFGVLLLEIVSGRSAFRPVGERDVRLLEWVRRLHCSETLMGAVDPRLGTKFNEAEAERVMLVGLWCSSPDVNGRPSINEAIQALCFHAKMPALVVLDPAMIDVESTAQGGLLPADTMNSDRDALATTISGPSICVPDLGLLR